MNTNKVRISLIFVAIIFSIFYSINIYASEIRVQCQPENTGSVICFAQNMGNDPITIYDATFNRGNLKPFTLSFNVHKKNGGATLKFGERVILGNYMGSPSSLIEVELQTNEGEIIIPINWN